MTSWWQQTYLWVADLRPSSLGWVFAFVALMLLFALLCIAMRLGRRVSFGGARGFVFEAPPPKSTPTKKDAP